MSLDLFRVSGGVADDNISYLSDTGSPVGSSGFTFEAPIGSYYSDYSTGITYKKVANAGVAADWLAQATSADIASVLSTVAANAATAAAATAAEATTARAAEATLTSGLAAEVAARTAADTTLTLPKIQ